MHEKKKKSLLTFGDIMAYKAINEKFPPEEWAKINAVKEKCEMTWAEFLPYAAKCVRAKKGWNE